MKLELFCSKCGAQVHPCQPCLGYENQKAHAQIVQDAKWSNEKWSDNVACAWKDFHAAIDNVYQEIITNVERVRIKEGR